MERHGESTGEGGRGQRPSIPLFLVSWACFVVAWLALTQTLDPLELIVGVVAAALAAGVAEIVRIQDFRLFRPRLRWVLRAFKLPAMVLADNWLLTMTLVRRLRGDRSVSGAFRAFRFDTGGDDGRSAARRALITAAITVTPNTYVVSIDLKANSILVHQLVPCAPERAREEILERL